LLDLRLVLVTAVPCWCCGAVVVVVICGVLSGLALWSGVTTCDHCSGPRGPTPSHTNRTPAREGRRGPSLTVLISIAFPPSLVDLHPPHHFLWHSQALCHPGIMPWEVEHAEEKSTGWEAGW
jgi:hypothetical protein